MTVESRPTRLRVQPQDREILRLALPALGALAAEPLYILADTAVVGHLGTEALAGLAVASGVLLIGYSIFNFLAYGTTAAVARLLGAGEDGRAAHQAVQGMWLATLIGLVLAVVGYAGGPAVVRVLGADGAVADNALLYLRLSLPGVPALLVTLAGTGYLRGVQDTRTPLLVAVASAVVNLALEVAVIYGLGFGIGASAVTTVVVQWGAAAVYLRWTVRAVHRHDVGLRPDPAAIGRLVRVGRDLLIRTLALRGAITVATAVATRMGPVSLAAHQIAFEMWNFLALVLDAVAIAAQAIIGRLLGAGDIDGARAAGRRMLEWGLLAGVAIGLVVGAASPVLPALFTPDPAVRSIAVMLLILAALMQPVNGVVFVLDGLLIGAGDLGYLAVAMVVGLVAFVPVALGVLAAGLGIAWLWAALILLMATRLATLLARWRSGDWAVTGATR
jgi:putative MATE family efflux protein